MAGDFRRSATRVALPGVLAGTFFRFAILIGSF